MGATGLVGSFLVDLLLKDDTFEKVYVLSRKTLGYTHPKLVEFVDNLDEPSAYRIAINDATHAFCCLGTTMKVAGSKEAFYKVDYGYCALFAQQAIMKGVANFNIVSALGADKKSGIFYNQVKGEIEELVMSLPFQSINILRPSLLIGARNELRIGEKIAQSIAPFLNLFLLGPLKKYQSIKGAQVAKALINLSKNNTSGIRIVENDELKSM